jgi:hypothetical protein
MNLPQIPQDKANHFIYGFVIYFLTNLFLEDQVSFGVVLFFAIGKELYDEYKCSTFDYKDLIATIVPGLVLILKNILL